MIVDVAFEERYWYPDDGGIVWLAGYQPVAEDGRFLARDAPELAGARMAGVAGAARFHEAVLRSGRWAVSILNEDGQDAATWFALRGRPLDGQLEKVTSRRGEYTGAGLLDDANAWLECRTWRTYDGGDHTIVVGEVVTAEVDDAVDDPLLYYRSHYAALLHSQASEKSPVALRSSIIEDGTAQSGA